MKTLILLCSLFSYCTFASQDRAEVPEILAGYYLVTNSSTHSAIQAYGIATCIGVTLFDGVNGVGAFMHVAGATDIPNAVSLVLSEMKNAGASADNLSVKLYGGWDNSIGEAEGTTYTSAQMIQSLLKEFSLRKISATEVSTLVTKEEADAGAQTSLNIELDLFSGQVYDFTPDVSFSGTDVSRPMPSSMQLHSL